MSRAKTRKSNLISCSCGGLGCKSCLDRQSPKIFLPIEPMGAVRTTQKQKFVDERAKRYYQYKQDIKTMAMARRLRPIEKGVGASVDVTFYMPIPRSWSQKKRDEHKGKPHLIKSDIDNLVKGFFDSLNKVAWYDDSQVYEVKSRKFYSDEPGIEFRIECLEG